MQLNLEFATSAGTITLLTIVTTKWETLKLSGFRILTFLISVFLSWIFFRNIQSDWLAYGLFTFLIVAILEWLGWKATISVNSVIGTHFLTTHDFGFHSIVNEFMLVMIGISLAILLNLIQDNEGQKTRIIRNMRYAEQELKRILEKLAAYLFNETIEGNVWDDIIKLENDLETYTDMAYEYQNNTFQSHPSYYIHYFEMRTKQCNVLHNLHYEMKRIRSLPKQAQIVGKYIIYLKDYVEERNDPVKQIHKLEQLFEDMKKEDLPKSREEFENRAKLYHILMDLEEFLVFKRGFIESLDERQKKIYWGEEKKKKISKNSQYYK